MVFGLGGKLGAVQRNKRDDGLVPAVYMYTCRRGADFPPEAFDQLRAANRLWNTLVEIDRTAETERHTVESGDQTVARLEAFVAAATAHVETVLDNVKRAKVRDLGKVDPGLRALLVGARTAKRSAVAGLKVARAEARTTMKPLLAEIETRRRASVKATYATYCQGDGRLYWATYNAVVAGFETARRRVIATRAAGGHAELRFRRFDGTGTITVQLQRQADDPVRSPASLDAGTSKWRNSVRLPHVDADTWSAWPPVLRKRWARSRTVTVKVAGDASMTLPVTWHRPLPDDADVAHVQVTRRKDRAGRPQVTVAVTVKTPAPTPAVGGPRVAVDVGWRSVPGGIRVATFVSDFPFPPLPNGWLRPLDSDGLAVQLVIPDAAIDQLHRSDKMRSLRDQERDRIRGVCTSVRGQLASLLDERWADDLATVHQWRSHDRFGRLVGALVAIERDQPGIVADTLGAENWQTLAYWRSQHHRHVGDMEDGLRRRFHRQRGEQYRIAAAWLAGHTGQVFISATSLDTIARVPGVEVERSEQDRRASWQRTVGGVHSLRGALSNVARRTGGALTLLRVARPPVHVGCGALLDRQAMARSVVVTCPGCGLRFDHDVNSAWLLLACAADLDDMREVE